ncbi:MAG: TssN family type VI secretion system protein, partial [Ginsengibacter sp.]
SGGKKPLVIGGISALLISAAAHFSTYFSDYLFTVFWILSGIFFVFGLLHLAFFHRKYFYSPMDDKGKVIIGELLFGLGLVFFVIVIFSLLQYFLGGNRSFLFYPMMLSTLAFFIPISFLYTFDALVNIPDPIFSTWEYPLSNPIELPEDNYNEKILVIAFEIAKNGTDGAKTNFRAKAPETMKLGDLYYHFMNDYNDQQSETPIRYADNEYTPHEWWFHLKSKWYQQHLILDPNLSVRENMIKENSIIICERIQH